MSKPIAAGTADFKEQVLDRQGLTLVDFWAPWCGPCRQLAPTLEQIGDELGDQLQVVKVDIQEHPEVGSSYRVMNIPFMMLFKDGEQVDQLLGNHPKAKIRSMIENHI